MHKETAIMGMDYEFPELAEAKFGEFVQGTSAPGGNPDNDSQTGGL